MVLVIGTKNCAKCIMTKNILDSKNIQYKYYTIEDLEDEKRENFMKMAIESAQRTMPLLIKDNKIISLQEV